VDEGFFDWLPIRPISELKGCAWLKLNLNIIFKVHLKTDKNYELGTKYALVG